MNAAIAAQIGGGMTACQAVAEAMSRDAPKQDESRPGGDMKLTEDGTAKTVVAMRCRDRSSPMTITRVAPRCYEMVVKNLSKPSDAPMRMTMSCTGLCSKSGGTLRRGRRPRRLVSMARKVR